MSKISIRELNNQKFELNKRIDQLKKHASKLKECDSKWYFEKIWDGSSANCSKLNEKIGYSASIARIYVKLNSSDFSGPEERAFYETYDNFLKSCEGQSSGQEGFGFMLIGGFISAVLSLVVPPFGYICYAISGDALYQHNSKLLTLAVTTSLAGLVGSGALIYKSDVMRHHCDINNDAKVKETLINYSNKLTFYQYEEDPKIVNYDCIDGFCYKRDCETIPLQINGSSFINSIAFECSDDYCYSDSCTLQNFEANDSTFE